MVIKKRKDVTKQCFCKLPLLWRKLRLNESLFILVLIQFQSHCHPRGGVGVGAYSRWALIQGWTLIQINTVTGPHCLQDTVDLKVLQYVTKVLTFQVNSLLSAFALCSCTVLKDIKQFLSGSTY